MSPALAQFQNVSKKPRKGFARPNSPPWYGVRTDLAIAVPLLLRPAR